MKASDFKSHRSQYAKVRSWNLMRLTPRKQQGTFSLASIGGGDGADRGRSHPCRRILLEPRLDNPGNAVRLELGLCCRIGMEPAAIDDHVVIEIYQVVEACLRNASIPPVVKTLLLLDDPPHRMRPSLVRFLSDVGGGVRRIIVDDKNLDVPAARHLQLLDAVESGPQ